MIINNIDGGQFKKALRGAVGLLERNKDEVNSLNVFPVPDGDTGTNMLLTIKSALKEGLAIGDNDTSEIAAAVSKGSLMGARGNSGVILSQLFRGFSSGLEGKPSIDIESLAKALKQASDTAYKAVMKPTEGTILTVARECGEFAMENYKKESDILVFLKKIIAHGNITLDKTPDMLDVLKQAGVVDAGGKGLIYIYTGIYNALAGIDVIDEVETVDNKPENHHGIKLDKEDIQYGYCTEFMVNTDYSHIETFRDEIMDHGDSLLVVGGEGIIKVHIHTNNPGAVLEKALKLGELSDIKIDNMRYQHEEILLKEELLSIKEEKKEKVKYSIVTISIGEGIDKIFKELNVDYIVPGGQTMNPSTEDILNAVEATRGENIYILPNNSNIILAAEQVKELTDRNVVVLPTRTIPEGISALLGFDESLDLETNTSNMKDNISNVKTAQVTYAVRDSEFNNTNIKKNDIIGLSSGDIIAKGSSLKDVSIDLIEKIIDEDISIITVFYGNNISEEDAKELVAYLEEKYQDIDVELLYGGQPLYYYIFSLE